jgi:hypothetical protein
MSTSMLVLFASTTRHVLSAVTVTVRPKTLLTVTDLVGTSLLIRNMPNRSAPPPPADWRLGIPPGEVDMAVVDFDDQVLANPFLYEMGPDGKARLLPNRSAPSITAAGSNTIKVAIAIGTLADVGLNALVCEENVASDNARVQRAVTDSTFVATVSTTVTTPRIVLGLIAGLPPAVASI